MESAYHMGRGALQLPTQIAVDTVRVLADGALNGVSSARAALTPAKSPEARGSVDELRNTAPTPGTVRTCLLSG
ncbi:hypothetical protein ALO43_200519 [Pseudomonas tremae]|uniref:3-oxoadipate enol-lactonase n=1 Tax=Pseudomonas tremae TaxID=200454 RepID=A0AA40P1M1_9PSED|nr:hypothetical protein ALO43_200519 [Pseudomonas tremae]